MGMTTIIFGYTGKEIKLTIPVLTVIKCDTIKAVHCLASLFIIPAIPKDRYVLSGINMDSPTTPKAQGPPSC